MTEHYPAQIYHVLEAVRDGRSPFYYGEAGVLELHWLQACFESGLFMHEDEPGSNPFWEKLGLPKPRQVAVLTGLGNVALATKPPLPTTPTGVAGKSNNKASDSVKRTRPNYDVFIPPEWRLLIEDDSLSSDEKLRRLSHRHQMFYDWDSVQLGELLGVTDAAIRATKWWKKGGDRARHLAERKEKEEMNRVDDD